MYTYVLTKSPLQIEQQIGDMQHAYRTSVLYDIRADEISPYNLNNKSERRSMLLSYTRFGRFTSRQNLRVQIEHQIGDSQHAIMVHPVLLLLPEAASLPFG